MPPICFKLKYNGIIRRVSFQELPNWLDLATKLHALYNLPLHNVGVSYIDSDHDEITVSSNEELQDFYQSSSQAGDAIKLIVFDVLDLSLSRDNSLSSPKRDNFDIVEPGWHPIHQFALADILLSKDLSDRPHAFVEAINSDTSDLLEKNLEDLQGSEDGHSTVQGSLKDKGKQKSSTSVASLINEEPGEKFPIYVLNHAVVSGMSATVNANDPVDLEEQIPLQSTPKVRTEEHKEPEPSAPAAEDPPLPSFDENAATNPSPNLYQDLASFLTMLNNVLSSHPELSEGIRNITNHATSGEYWRAYSSSVSDAAQRFSQNTDAEARRIESEAVRKISDILANLQGFFSPENVNQHTSQNGGQQEQNAQSSDATHRSYYPFSQFGPRFETSNPLYGPRPFRSSRGWNPHWHGGPPPPHWFPGSFIPPPPPLPPFPGAHPPPPAGIPLRANNIPPPPPRRPWPQYQYHNSHVPPHVPPSPASPPQTPLSPAAPPQSTSIPGKTAFSDATRNDTNAAPQREPALATDTLRAKVEQAKQLYRAHKDLYRQERAHRREKEKAVRGEIPISMLPSTSGSSREPAEMTWPAYSHGLPKRAHTHIGYGVRRHGYKSEDLNARAQTRIMKKLADMGFTENSHPHLSERVAALLPTGDVISKDGEDDIVTTLLEELIPVSPKPSQAESSRRNNPLPGAWQ